MCAVSLTKNCTEKLHDPAILFAINDMTAVFKDHYVDLENALETFIDKGELRAPMS